MTRFSGRIVIDSGTSDVSGEYFETESGWSGWVKGKHIRVGDFVLTMSDGRTGVIQVNQIQQLDDDIRFLFKTQGPIPS